MKRKNQFFNYQFVLPLLAVILAALYANQAAITNFYQGFFGNLPRLEQLPEQLTEKAQQQVNTPPPLRAKQESPTAHLTTAGVINFTNQQRAEQGLAPLVENSLLNTSAAQKAADMFAKQYFQHDSPEGIGVSELANGAGYQFIVIGENLALGNFLNDQELVQGWMDSPGHRANILHQQYTELGVAVLQGTYQGETTWIAVQHFGKPLSACAQPSSGLNQQIETNKQRLTQMAADLQARQEELAQMDQNHPEYNQKVDEYNQRVEEYNRLISETEQLVNTYNEQVAAFNRCAAS